MLTQGYFNVSRSIFCHHLNDHDREDEKNSHNFEAFFMDNLRLEKKSKDDDAISDANIVHDTEIEVGIGFFGMFGYPIFYDLLYQKRFVQSGYERYLASV